MFDTKTDLNTYVWTVFNVHIITFHNKPFINIFSF